MKLKIKTIYNGYADVSEHLITAQNFFKKYNIDLEFSENPIWRHIDLTIRPEMAGGSTNIKQKYDGAYKVWVGLMQDYMPNGQRIWRDIGQILIHEILHCLWAEMGMGDIHNKNLGVKDNVRVMEMVKATNHPKRLLLHHSGSQTDTYESIKAYHISKGWGDVAYHFVITRDARILVGRWEIKSGTHTIGQNEQSISICVLGHFGLEKPTQGQIERLKTIIEADLPLTFHRDFSPTECPGDNLVAIFKTMKLIKLKGGKDVYAIDRNGILHLIFNSDTFNEGRDAGWWGNWDEVEEKESLPSERGSAIIFAKED